MGFNVSGAENGAERAKKSDERSGTVSESWKKRAKRGMGGRGALSGDHRNGL